MRNLKDEIIGRIIAKEQGYVDNAKDKGGRTKYGITTKIALSNGYIGDIRQLPYATAYDIYSKKYWDVNMIDDIAYLSPALAEEIADTGVNMGPGRAATFLQRSLNVLNKEEQLFDDVAVDAQIGLKTLAALTDFLKVRGKDGEKVLLKMLNALQIHKYIRLAERDSTQEEFEFGWVLKRG